MERNKLTAREVYAHINGNPAPTAADAKYALEMLTNLGRDWLNSKNWTERRERLWQKYTATWNAYRAANFNQVEGAK